MNYLLQPSHDLISMSQGGNTQINERLIVHADQLLAINRIEAEKLNVFLGTFHKIVVVYAFKTLIQGNYR